MGGAGDSGGGNSDIDDEMNERNQDLAGEESKNKMVDDGNEEPRSKIVTDALPSDDAPSSSSSKLWDLPADFDVYCINKFESVTVGKEAGWPGQWEEVVEEEMTEGQLLNSLHVKGSAMSDDAWQEHWAQIGPGLLAHGWIERYPSVSLLQVEQITGVTFLSQVVQNDELANAVERLSLNKSSLTSEDTESKKEMNKNLDPPNLSGLNIDCSATNENTSELVTADVNISNESQPQLAQQNFTAEEITEMWSNFYNEYYWYCYQQFVGEVGGASQQSNVVNLIEDYVTAKKCFGPPDNLVTTEENDVVTSVNDKTVPLTPDNKTVEQSAAITCTDHADSEPENLNLAKTDTPVAVCTPLDTTHSSVNSQEEHRKEVSDLEECEGQADQTEMLTSQEHSKNELSDSKEHREDENTSNPEKLEGKKGDQLPPADDKNVTQKVVWQLSKSAQYTSIVWALQEAGIISSAKPSSEVANGQASCGDQIHCNGTTPDKETDDCEHEDATNEASGVTGNTVCSAASSSSAINDDQSAQQSLKRKR